MIKAAVIGATGFTGALLARMLQAHPEAEASVLTSSSFVGRRVDEVFPEIRNEAEYVAYEPAIVSETDVAFVCYPHTQAHPIVAELRERGVRVVDLSADFRLPAEDYPEWYGFRHPRPDLVQEAVYGLPERYRERIRAANIVANPGCFPTGMLLAVLPLAGWLELDLVVVDSKSGVSGAGKTPSAKTHFSTVHDNFRSYTEIGHRHVAEMIGELSRAAGHQVPVSFTPHLLPVDRGILSTVYSRPSAGAEMPDEEALRARYQDFYQGEPFVEVREHAPALSEVQYTNYCRVAPLVDRQAGIIKVVSAIDNLVKGASGQAVQNMNLMFGLAETMGLEGRL